MPRSESSCHDPSDTKLWLWSRCHGQEDAFPSGSFVRSRRRILLAIVATAPILSRPDLCHGHDLVTELASAAVDLPRDVISQMIVREVCPANP